jgi:hypothetical protein
MRYQIKGQWPVDRTLLAAGTIVDTGQDEWKWLANTPPRIDTGATEWRSLADRVPPMNAQALNQACYDVMAAKYPTNWILSGPGVNRHADLGRF